MAKMAAISWLLGSDPAIRWQVLRDIVGAPEHEWRTERAKVETEGFGARLLSLQDADGQWAGGAFVPAGFTKREWEEEGQPHTATFDALTMLREFGLDPSCERMRKSVALIGANSRWDHAGQPYWEGEVEECINGRTVADGAYFGVDVSTIVVRLLRDRQIDGGWNCERCNGSVRTSFATTINVLEGLLAFEQATGGTTQTQNARRTAEEYLLQRHLYRRLSTGAPANEDFLRFIHPNSWRYDILRSLDYFRAAAQATDVTPDPRLEPAIACVRSRRLPDGRWPLDIRPRGRQWFELDEGPGQPSRRITLRALRVLQWWDRFH